MRIRLLVLAAVFLATPIAVRSQISSNGTRPRPSISTARKAVTGPGEPINRAIAGGATATITLQPVPPKTVPASSYPPGSSIVDQTLTLGAIPARVWLEVHVTGWAPEAMRLAAIEIDATDQAGDGGGFSGANATCNGAPLAQPGGDLFPAIVPCSGVCQGTMVPCTTTQNCIDSGTTGPCTNLSATCRASLSGITMPCSNAEPSRCTARPPFFPPGGNVCEFAFQDACDEQWIGTGTANTRATDLSTMDVRAGDLAEPGEALVDFFPSYLLTMVVDVPMSAKGEYRIDLFAEQTFLHNSNTPPNNNIPIAALNSATIKVNTCTSDMQCQDNDVCTVDDCQDGCCAHIPVAGWNPATECCDPMSGVQALIPPSTPCRIGGCSEGGSSGSPTYTNVPDGTACISQDQCDLPGECAAGICDAEEYAGSNCPKARFISFDIDTGATPSAYRVRLVSLHHPVPPYFGGLASDFSAYEGEYRWVGDATTYVESTTNSTPVHAALLECDPFYRDWSAIDLLHVTGSAVVPSSVYEVQSIAQGLDINEESNYSAPITVVTGRWGDVVYPYNPPSSTVQPDATDHAALTDKFRSLMGSVSKPRALLSGSGMSDIPDLTLDVDFAEISSCLDAFRGRPYPYGGPTPCP